MKPVLPKATHWVELKDLPGQRAVGWVYENEVVCFIWPQIMTDSLHTALKTDADGLIFIVRPINQIVLGQKCNARQFTETLSLDDPDYLWYRVTLIVDGATLFEKIDRVPSR